MFSTFEIDNCQEPRNPVVVTAVKLNLKANETQINVFKSITYNCAMKPVLPQDTFLNAITLGYSFTKKCDANFAFLCRSLWLE